MSALAASQQSYLEAQYHGRVTFRKGERKLYGHDIAAMPVVIEPANPYGPPTAISGSPTCNVAELVITRGMYSVCGAVAESAARSA